MDEPTTVAADEKPARKRSARKNAQPDTGKTLTYDRPGQPAKEERLAMLRRHPKPRERKEITELPIWVRNAIAKHELCGMSWKKCAEEAGKAGSRCNLHAYAASPAGRQWAAELRDVAKDPQAVGKYLVRQQSGPMTLEAMQLYDALKNSGNIPEAAKHHRHLIDHALGSVRQDAPPSTIIIQLGGGITEASILADIPLGEASSERVGDTTEKVTPGDATQLKRYLGR